MNTKLPELPEPTGSNDFGDYWNWQAIEAYGEACRASAPAEVGDGVEVACAIYDAARGHTWEDCANPAAMRAVLAATRPAVPDGWIAVGDRLPERNQPVIYWHKSVSGSGGFLAIADEWRDEHHLAHATYWMAYKAPRSDV